MRKKYPDYKVNQIFYKILRLIKKYFITKKRQKIYFLNMDLDSRKKIKKSKTLETLGFEKKFYEKLRIVFFLIQMIFVVCYDSKNIEKIGKKIKVEKK